MAYAPIRLDALSPLSHKERIGLPGEQRPAALPTIASWVPVDDQRRLDGYEVLDAYTLNVARTNLPVDTDADVRAGWREYGDVDALAKRIIAAVLGDDWSIGVDGADDDLLAGPDLPEQPTEPATGDEIARRIYDGRMRAWRAQVDAAVTVWEQAIDDQPAAVARQGDLRGWADRTMFAAHLHQAEHEAVTLGDAVYVLWRRDGDWPTIEVHHPGFYFPDLADDDRGQYPRRVDFGWEYDVRDPDGTEHRRIRRVTFELVPIAYTRYWPDGTLIDVDGTPLADDAEVTLHATDRMVDGTIWRQYPWAEQGDLSDVTCAYTSASWAIEDTEGRDLRNLPTGLALIDAWRQDQHCDFLPVVHVPNTPAGGEHFGTATFTPHAQLLDDIAQTDTRIMDGSQFLGSPTAAVAGAQAGADAIALTAGTAIGLGVGGRMDMLDMSSSIEKLYDLADRLGDRLLANIGAPREVMGRVDESTASGIHLLIKYAPWAQIIGAMRITREPKMRLLLKMAQRLAQVSEVFGVGPTPVARLRYGNFLPMDRADAIDQVARALDAHAISTQTALRILVAAGLPIDDATAELARIYAEDTAAAKDLADATGSEQVAAERLGVDLPAAAAVAPALNLP